MTRSRIALLRTLGALALLLPLGIPAAAETAPAAAAERPNIVLIMADDMGWSDLGCYGGEIPTPHLDRLAERGLRFTQFYNTGRCCPTRASLLTGLYSHRAGIGHMTADAGEKFPGYRGRLNHECATIAELLRAAGYFTAHTGKWHVGAGAPERLPLAWGFDRFYGVPEGGGFYFRPQPGRTVRLNEQVLHSAENPPPAEWYSTDAWNEYALRFLEEARAAKKPFFLYLAHNAPHFPLQATPEMIARHKGRYEAGWEAVREARYARMRELGLIDDRWPLSPPDPAERSWLGLSEEERRREAHAMEIYAAVLERMDHTVGELVAALEKHGELENTLILFLADNGASAEGGLRAVSRQAGEWGTAESHLFYGHCWANVSDTPFRLFKKANHEGGIATPLVAHWPKGIPHESSGGLRHEPAHVIDLMATCLDLADTPYPAEFAGRRLAPLPGKSLRPLLAGGREPLHEALYWEHEGNRAVRQGDWKLVSQGARRPWELYNLAEDRTELNDLAARHPARVRQMAAAWRAWARENHVVPHPQGRFAGAAAGD